jgi:small subunit ribosomal protein S9
MTEDTKKKSKKTVASNQKKEAPKKKVVLKKKALESDSAPKKKTVITKESTPTATAKKRPAMSVPKEYIYATGRRKSSVAKVWLFKGNGRVQINRQDPLVYLSSERLISKVMFPLNLMDLASSYDVRVDVLGGGLAGQADAATLGVSRAVLAISEDFRKSLREHGLLTQDRREKERKKYGKRGARKSPQFRKR